MKSVAKGQQHAIVYRGTKFIHVSDERVQARVVFNRFYLMCQLVKKGLHHL